MASAPAAGESGVVVTLWLEWLEEPCTLERHAHARKDCRECRRQALLGCASLERPDLW